MKRGLRMAALTLLMTLLSGHALAYDPLPYEMAPAPYGPHEESFLPDNAGYHDDSLDIRVETFRQYDTDIMAVYVTVADASQLRAGSANPNHPLSKAAATVYQIAKRYNAVLAIDGDYFMFQDRDKKTPRGYIVRNAQVLREVYKLDRETLLIDKNGDFFILPTTEEDIAPYKGNILHTFWFGPALVVNGERITDEAIAANALDIGKNKSTQRIALCQTGPLSYMIVASEGPESEPKGSQKGLTLEQFAQVCYDLGCITAYNLDGGSSTQIVLNSSQNTRKINSPSNQKQRPIGDIIYFATLVP